MSLYPDKRQGLSLHHICVIVYSLVLRLAHRGFKSFRVQIKLYSTFCASSSLKIRGLRCRKVLPNLCDLSLSWSRINLIHLPCSLVSTISYQIITYLPTYLCPPHTNTLSIPSHTIALQSHTIPRPSHRYSYSTFHHNHHTQLLYCHIQLLCVPLKHLHPSHTVTLLSHSVSLCTSLRLTHYIWHPSQ